LFSAERGRPHQRLAQPSGLRTRSTEAGYFTSKAAGRIGRGTRLPPQFGQIPRNTSPAQAAQNVHSKVQIIASVASGGRSLSQHSQLGRSWSMENLLVSGENNTCVSETTSTE
jgi:hypothetical protein